MIHKDDILIYQPPGNPVSTWRITEVGETDIYCQKLTENSKPVIAQPTHGQFRYLEEQFRDGWVKVDKETKVLNILKKIDADS